MTVNNLLIVEILTKFCSVWKTLSMIAVLWIACF